jgi:hypothetical protein
MWATLWLSGAVAMTLGFAEMPLEHCEALAALIEEDIAAGVVEVEGELWVETPEGELLPWQPWEVTCEDEMLELGTQK